MVGDFGVVGLGADSVELAVEFLAEKVEGASDGFVGVQERCEFLEVGIESGEFFRDIAAVGEEGDFLGDSFVVVIDIESGICEPLVKEFALSGRDGGGQE